MKTPPPLPVRSVPAVETPANFEATLRQFQRRWRGALLLVGVLRAALAVGLALLAFGLLDYYAGFSDPIRWVVGGVIATLAAAGALAAVWLPLVFLRRDAAVAADHALDTGRREVLSALELGSAAPADKAAGLTGWLRVRTVQTAANRLRALRGARALPVGDLKRYGWKVGAMVSVMMLCAILQPSATFTVTRRLLQPGADVPPYSPLRFVVGPQPAEVLYGGEMVVTAQIDGGKLEAPVRCLTRDPATGRIDDSPAFHENGVRYSRKLEKVAMPVEVAFAVGRARSAWLPIAVLMQPKIQEVLLTVEPPAYSALPRREFALGTQELAVLPGSRVTARVTSNRPLESGLVQIVAAAPNVPVQEVAAAREQTHLVRFTWIARQAAMLSLEVRDALGTRSEPLTLELKMAPDERPQVTLRQPAGDVLATPDTALPVEASSSDDLGLSRIAIVRQLRGYRERSQPQSVSRGQRRHEFAGTLDLAALGLQPGHVVELTLEAGDTNPNLLGVTTSEPARVHIIAREQYAELLRNQTTLEDFAGRYEALRDALEKARKSLDALESAAQSGDAAAAEAARKAALDAHGEAAKLFGLLAKDFPLFDLDVGLAKASGDAMEQLFENAKALEALAQAQPDVLMDALSQLRDRLGKGDAAMAEELQQGERAVAVAQVFDQAGRFREWLAAQRRLVKDYNRVLEQIRRGETQAGQAMRDLGRNQEEIADGVRQLSAELGSALDALPEEFARMVEEGRKFIEGLEELEIVASMKEGAAAAASGDGKTAGDRAGEALAKMEALLRRDNAFCEMCRGEGGSQPFPWPADLAQTLEQLMRALVMKPERGGEGEGEDPGNGGTAGAGGFGGLSDSGYAMRGKLPQLPIYGPSRQRFSRNANPQLGGGEGRGGTAGTGRPEDGADVDAGGVEAQAARPPGGEAIAIEAVPNAYRAAAKRYFSQEDAETKQ